MQRQNEQNKYGFLNAWEIVRHAVTCYDVAREQQGHKDRDTESLALLYKHQSLLLQMSIEPGIVFLHEHIFPTLPMRFYPPRLMTYLTIVLGFTLKIIPRDTNYRTKSFDMEATKKQIQSHINELRSKISGVQGIARPAAAAPDSRRDAEDPADESSSLLGLGKRR